ncbi:MAG: hypothetical protein QM578_18925 [Pantoea sp.]|jgi:hypothetical protein|uniref:hypothetical protein n=1 Tax=Pantoea sp. TaxID=69393 RepID=UPI0039E57DED
MAMVRVYKFRRYEITTDEVVTGKRYATEQGIKQLCAEIILGTGVDISDVFVDADGMVKRGVDPTLS